MTFLYKHLHQERIMDNTDGKTVLVEANPNDKKFAVGKSLFSKDIWDSSKWNGENKLGKALMKIREALSEVDQNSFNSLELS